MTVRGRIQARTGEAGARSSTSEPTRAKSQRTRPSSRQNRNLRRNLRTRRASSMPLSTSGDGTRRAIAAACERADRAPSDLGTRSGGSPPPVTPKSLRWRPPQRFHPLAGQPLRSRALRAILGIRRHVSGGTLEQIGIFAEQTKRVVAPHAQEAADLTGAVIVIDVEGDASRRQALAERAHAALCLEDGVVLLDLEVELVAQMNLAELLESLVAILFGPSLYAPRVGPLPRADSRDLPFGILPVSPEPNCVRARFAGRSPSRAPRFL